MNGIVRPAARTVAAAIGVAALVALLPERARGAGELEIGLTARPSPAWELGWRDGSGNAVHWTLGPGETHSGTVELATASLGLRTGMARGQRYPAFPGSLRLMDGRAFDEATRAVCGAIRSERMELEFARAAEVPLYYMHARRIRGDAWAIRSALPPREGTAAGARIELQGIAADSGDQVLTFRTQDPLTVRRIDTALMTEIEGTSGQRRVRWTAAGAMSQWSSRDGTALASGSDWAGLLRLSTGSRNRLRIEVMRVGPGFRFPLVGEDAPARDRLVASARAGASLGRVRYWGEATGRATAAGVPLDAGVRLGATVASASGPAVEAEVAGVAQDGLSAARVSEAALEVSAGGHRASVELRPGSGPQYAFGMESAGWSARVAWYPQEGTGRLEAGWGPGGFVPGWPATGVRIVHKWRAERSAVRQYAEAGWWIGEHARVGLRWGTWDQGRIDAGFDSEPSWAVSFTWRFVPPAAP